MAGQGAMETKEQVMACIKSVEKNASMKSGSGMGSMKKMSMGKKMMDKSEKM